MRHSKLTKTMNFFALAALLGIACVFAQLDPVQHAALMSVVDGLGARDATRNKKKSFSSFSPRFQAATQPFVLDLMPPLGARLSIARTIRSL